VEIYQCVAGYMINRH